MAIRVLLVNEPRSYREAIATAVRALGPAGVEVFLAEAEDLEREVNRLAPDLVVCSRLSEAVEERVLSWVELYPGHGSKSRIGVGPERTTVEEIELPELLSVVERAGKLAGVTPI
jgi:hypothetical protein